jgi:hypothetical protein
VARYEFGEDTADELDGDVAAQLRWRLSQPFEPALELYADDEIAALGPAAVGTIALAGRNRLKWEAAALLAVEHDIADKVFRAALEFEF